MFISNNYHIIGDKIKNVFRVIERHEQNTPSV